MSMLAEEMLRGSGLRVTRPRLSVIEAVSAHPHSDAATVYALSSQRLDGVSVQAVYDCLHALTSAGVLRRIQPAGSVARYELQANDNHHHVVCRGCGQVEDVDCSKPDPPCMTPPTDHGFALDEAEVIYWGQCPACAATAATAAPASPDVLP